ncbi:MAG TPA: DUF2975 domain-containing protein [Caulobacteraceae bacterium]|jgi:hypothetical protein|nr:DUF2975 domain-containing protein [Caulobacteraceae bacterium]
MAQVLEFDPVAAAPPAEPPMHRRIRTASRLLAALFGVIFAAYCLFVAAGILAFVIPYAGDHLTIGPKGMMLYVGPEPAHAVASPTGYVPVASLPLLQRLAHVAVGPVVIAPGLMIFWNLRQLFRLYGRGVVFAEANARLIKHIGLWLAAAALAPLVTTNVLAAVHMRIDQNWFHADTIPEILLGGVVYVIGMVMQVGHELEQEQEQFV